MRTGNANASERASKASKNVALPTTIRAFACHRENGTFSIRPIKPAASICLCSITLNSRQEMCGDLVGTLDRGQVSRSGNYCQCGAVDRLVQLPGRGDGGGEVL